MIEPFHDDLGNVVRELAGLAVGQEARVVNDNNASAAAYAAVMLYKGFTFEYRVDGGKLVVRRTK